MNFTVYLKYIYFFYKYKKTNSILLFLMAKSIILNTWQNCEIFYFYQHKYNSLTSWTFLCSGYDTKLNLMVRLLFWRFGECRVPLHCYYSLVHSDPSTGQIDLFKNYLYLRTHAKKPSKETTTQEILIWMYNEHDFLTSRYKITLE